MVHDLAETGDDDDNYGEALVHQQAERRRRRCLPQLRVFSGVTYDVVESVLFLVYFHSRFIVEIF